MDFCGRRDSSLRSESFARPQLFLYCLLCRQRTYLPLIRNSSTTRIVTNRNVLMIKRTGVSASIFPFGGASAAGAGAGGSFGAGIATGMAAGAAGGDICGRCGMGARAGIAGTAGRTKAGPPDAGAAGWAAGESGVAVGTGWLRAEMIRVYSPGPGFGSRTGAGAGAGAGGASVSLWMNWVTPPESKSGCALDLRGGW